MSYVYKFIEVCTKGCFMNKTIEIRAPKILGGESSTEGEKYWQSNRSR